MRFFAVVYRVSYATKWILTILSSKAMKWVKYYYSLKLISQICLHVLKLDFLLARQYVFINDELYIYLQENLYTSSHTTNLCYKISWWSIYGKIYIFYLFQENRVSSTSMESMTYCTSSFNNHDFGKTQSDFSERTDSYHTSLYTVQSSLSTAINSSLTHQVFWQLIFKILIKKTHICISFPKCKNNMNIYFLITVQLCFK